MAQQAGNTFSILRLPQVLQRIGLARSTLYLRIEQHLWTKPVSLGARAVGWPDNEVTTLNAARIAGKSDDEIRVVVSNLESARKAAA